MLLIVNYLRLNILYNKNKSLIIVSFLNKTKNQM